MNEERIERHLGQWAEANPAPEHLRARVARPAPRARPLRLALATAALAGVATLALWPQDAAAGALARMETRIKEARTMYAAMYGVRGAERGLVSETWYQNGAWKLDYHQWRPHYRLLIWFKGSETTIYRPYADEWWTDNAQRIEEAASSPLDFAMRATDYGKTSNPRQMRKEDRPGGRYALTFTRDGDNHYWAEIEVDGRTDLPIRSVLVQQAGDRLTTEYRWNEPISDETMRPNPPRTPVSVPAEIARWNRRWAEPLAQRGRATLWDLRATQDGTVWAVVSGWPLQSSDSGIGDYYDSPREPEFNPLPGYVRAARFSTQGDRLGEKQFEAYVPIEPGTPSPGRLTVLGQRVKVISDPEGPAYRVGLGVSRTADTLEPSAWRARAVYWAKHGDREQEAACRDRARAAAMKISPNLAKQL